MACHFFSMALARAIYCVSNSKLVLAQWEWHNNGMPSPLSQKCALIYTNFFQRTIRKNAKFKKKILPKNLMAQIGIKWHEMARAI